MARPGRFSPEVRERAVRMVFEHTAAHPSQWAAITSIAAKLGCSAETLRTSAIPIVMTLVPDPVEPGLVVNRGTSQKLIQVVEPAKNLPARRWPRSATAAGSPPAR